MTNKRSWLLKMAHFSTSLGWTTLWFRLPNGPVNENPYNINFILSIMTRKTSLSSLAICAAANSRASSGLRIWKAANVKHFLFSCLILTTTKIGVNSSFITPFHKDIFWLFPFSFAFRRELVSLSGRLLSIIKHENT